MRRTPALIGGAALVVLTAIAFMVLNSDRSRGIDVPPPAKPMETVELRNGDRYPLTASAVTKTIDGASFRLLAYNGSIPGPLIKVPQGAEIVVDFTNRLDMPTLLHSHGVRMENAFDGSQVVQREIPPGGSFSYRLRFPDAGMFWYHPHVREDYQQELGLYGNFLVVPEDAAYWNPVDREVALFLDDVLIENGRIPLDPVSIDRTLMGRYGNVMLVNGETHHVLRARKGEVFRLYLTNAANARPFRIAIDGVRLKRVGADGGAYEHDEWVDAVTISPSERVVVEAYFPDAGTFPIVNRTPESMRRLGTVEVSDDGESSPHAGTFSVTNAHSATMADIAPFHRYFDRAPDKTIVLTMAGTMDMSSMGHGAHMMPDGTMMAGGMMGPSPDGIEWEETGAAMNAASNEGNVVWKIVDQDDGAENMDIRWTLARGKPVKVRIVNDPNAMHPMQHPIHFHGQRFLVLERDGVPEKNLAWKDTVLVPAGSVIDILLDPSNPGVWMAHCHIAEHLGDGMMFTFDVEGDGEGTRAH